MPYCSNCRNYIPDGQTQCPNCGITSEKKNMTRTTQSVSPPSAPIQKKNFKTFWAGKDLTDTFSQTDIESNRWYALVSYLGPLIIFTFFSFRRTGSKYAFFHFGQSLSFLINWVLFFLETSLLLEITQGSFFTLLALVFLLVQLMYLIACQFRALGACVIGKAVQYSIIGKLNISNLLYKRHR